MLTVMAIEMIGKNRGHGLRLVRALCLVLIVASVVMTIGAIAVRCALVVIAAAIACSAVTKSPVLTLGI